MAKQPDEVVNLVTLDLDPDDPQVESLAQGRWIQSIHWTVRVKGGLSRDAHPPPSPKPTSSVLIGRAKQPVNHKAKCALALFGSFLVCFVFYK